MAVVGDRSELERVNIWLTKMESDPEWLEVENRPWSNEYARWSRSQCQGYDFAHHDPRVKMRFFWNEKTQTLMGSVHWDNRTEGPPGGSHGASIMLVFDEILAYPVWRGGEPAFTANVNLDLKKMIPFNQAATFVSKVTHSERRKRYIEAQIMNYDQSTIYASGKGLWVVAAGMGSTMAVHAATIASDLEREAVGQRVLSSPLVPGAETDVNQSGMLTIDAHCYRPIRGPDVSGPLTLFQTESGQGLAQSFFNSYNSTPPNNTNKSFPLPPLMSHI